MEDNLKIDSDSTIGPRRNTRNRAWTFTWNNYSEETIQYLIKEFSGTKTHTQYIFGKEIGEKEGTPHLQGVVKFTNQRSFNSMCKLFKNNHIEVCSNWFASINYCMKGKDYLTNIDLTQINVRKLSTQEKMDKMIIETKFLNVVWKEWQQQIINLLETHPDDRTIHWVYDYEGGKGKSFLALWLDIKYDIIVADGKKDNVLNQIKLYVEGGKIPRIVVLDIPRHNINYINYGLLEMIKSGLLYSGKYEGGKIRIPNVHVVVFSNSEPDYEKWTKDRYNVIKISEREIEY